jgi:CRP-like cAMP-binding protein
MDPKQLAGIPLFASLAPYDRERVPEGRELIREGAFGYEFFAIREGTAEVRHDGTVIGTLGPGDYFGEIALIETERRTASVVATSPMELVVLTRQAFRQIEQAMPGVAAEIRDTIRRRLERTAE